MKKIAVLTLIALTLLIAGCSQSNNSGHMAIQDSSQREKKPLAVAPHLTDTSIKHIYITFDDGPLEGSQDIDDAVRKEQINVNVFVVGMHALSNANMKNFYHLYQTNPYIQIGNHSYSHAYNHYIHFYSHPDSVVQDFLKCQAQLNIPNKLARLPGRNQWRLNGVRITDVKSGSVTADKLYQMGYKVFGWDVEWQHDPKTGDPIQTVDDMVDLIQRKLNDHKTVRPGNLILLAHDEMFRNGWEESELKQLIDKLKATGHYSFDHLSDYPG